MKEDAKQFLGCALIVAMLALGLLGTGLAWVLTPDGFGWALVSIAAGILSALVSTFLMGVVGRRLLSKAGA